MVNFEKDLFDCDKTQINCKTTKKDGIHKLFHEKSAKKLALSHPNHLFCMYYRKTQIDIHTKRSICVLLNIDKFLPVFIFFLFIIFNNSRE